MCSFNATVSYERHGKFSKFLAYDVIIFDFGLFHQLIRALQACIANQMDGGYMRYVLLHIQR